MGCLSTGYADHKDSANGGKKGNAKLEEFKIDQNTVTADP